MMSQGKLNRTSSGEQVGKWSGERAMISPDAYPPTLTLSHIRFGVFCLLFGVGYFSCPAAPVKIELPPETSVFKPGPGADIANAQCLVCHSVEYVLTQPPLPRTFWASSVKKMREKYGSAIPEEQVEPLQDYLTQYYGVGDTNNPQATGSNPIKPTRPMAGTTTNPEAIATQYGCLSHDVSYFH